MMLSDDDDDRSIRPKPDATVIPAASSGTASNKIIPYSSEDDLVPSLLANRANHEGTKKSGAVPIEDIMDLYGTYRQSSKKPDIADKFEFTDFREPPLKNVMLEQKGPSAQISMMKLQLQLLNKYDEDILDVHKILWEGGFLWKIPFNGKGIPERRTVSIKRAPYPSIYSKAVRVLGGGTSNDVLAGGGLGTIAGYISYPPTLIWYDPDKAGEELNARELALVGGAHVVSGHGTQAFWKLSDREGPTPRPELCFSMVTGVRSLDLAAETSRSSGEWKRALNALLTAIAPDNESSENEGSPVKGDELRSGNTAAGKKNSVPNSIAVKSGSQFPTPLPPPFPPNSSGRSGKWDKEINREVERTHRDVVRERHTQSVAHLNGRQYSQRMTSAVQEREHMESQSQSQQDLLKRQMFSAAKTGDYQLLEAAFKAGVSSNALEPKTSDTPLIMACRLGDPDIVRLCLHYGAKNDPHPDFGQTALHAACAEGQFDAAAALLIAAEESQADSIICNLTDSTGQTPLHIAASRGDTEIFDLLLSHGADILRADDLQQTVAHLCATTGKNDCLGLILDLEGDALMEEKDSFGNTPLHLAALKGHQRCVRVLLETAASVVAVNNLGQTPYKLARLRGHHQVGMLLMDYEENYRPSYMKNGAWRSTANINGQIHPDSLSLSSPHRFNQSPHPHYVSRSSPDKRTYFNGNGNDDGEGDGYFDDSRDNTNSSSRETLQNSNSSSSIGNHAYKSYDTTRPVKSTRTPSRSNGNGLASNPFGSPTAWGVSPRKLYEPPTPTVLIRSASDTLLPRPHSMINTPNLSAKSATPQKSTYQLSARTNTVIAAGTGSTQDERAGGGAVRSNDYDQERERGDREGEFHDGPVRRGWLGNADEISRNILNREKERLQFARPRPITNSSSDLTPSRDRGHDSSGEHGHGHEHGDDEFQYPDMIPAHSSPASPQPSRYGAPESEESNSRSYRYYEEEKTEGAYWEEEKEKEEEIEGAEAEEEAETFLFSGFTWSIYTTAEGYDYYLSTVNNQVVHSQWEDPRISGFIALETAEGCTDSSGGVSTTPTKVRSSSSDVRSPGRSPPMSRLSPAKTKGRIFFRDGADSEDEFKSNANVNVSVKHREGRHSTEGESHSESDSSIKVTLAKKKTRRRRSIEVGKSKSALSRGTKIES